MNYIRKIDGSEVKRCFVNAQLVKVHGGRRGCLSKLSQSDFKLALRSAKQESLRMTEQQLDDFIRAEYPPRLEAYNSSDWYIGTVCVGEVGVWKRAGELPLRWTNGSLKETARHVESIPLKSSLARTRARRIVHAMLTRDVTELQSEKYLYPIVFEGGTGTPGRKLLRRKMNGDIDDGCMRSIALTISGKKTLKAYIGTPK